MNLKNKMLSARYYGTFFSMVLLLIFILTSARFAKTNFAGEWTLNKEKSKITEGGQRILFNRLMVNQNGNDLTIARTGQSPDGQEFTMEEKILLDGKDSENTFFDGMVKKKSKTKWSADEKILTITSAIVFNRDGNEVTMNATETWDINQSPGALTINYATTTPNGESKDVYVYTKK
ncbi:MAG: hypothetical protein JWQ14_1988 [Adhaeribacter sp.]|nr:hypothetical protein [Adhaeribacter sp.]